jgi:hypothetical protein
MAKRKAPQTKVSGISQLPTGGKSIAPLGFKSKILPGSLTNLINPTKVTRFNP